MAYERPPIVEAVIEFKWSAQVPFEELNKASRRFLSRYPVDETDHNVEAIFTPATASAIARHQEVGKRLSSSDRSEVLLLGRDAVAFAQLAPYPGWEAFSGRVQQDYEAVKDALGNRELSRVGVRYINRIDIPNSASRPPPASSITDFLQLELPAVSVGGGSPTAYTFQVDQPLTPMLGLKLTSATIQPLVPDTWALLLDIDIYRDVDIPRKDTDLWALLADIRNWKNRVFEMSITDASRKLFGNDHS